MRVTSAAESIFAHSGVHSHVSEAFTVWNAPARGHALRVAPVGHGGTNPVILAHLLGVAPVPWEWLRFKTVLAAVSVVALRPVKR